MAHRLRIRSGDVLSVGCGWHPGRHLFPAPAFRIVAVDADPERVAGVAAGGRADEAHVGYAGRLPFKDASFDVVLYRLVMHHLAYQGPLEPYFAEAARAAPPRRRARGHRARAVASGGARTGARQPHRRGDGDPRHARRHPPLTPAPTALATNAKLSPELHAITYTWRRMPGPVQRALQPVDELGSRPRAAPFGHTLLLIARKSAAGRNG